MIVVEEYNDIMIGEITVLVRMFYDSVFMIPLCIKMIGQNFRELSIISIDFLLSFHRDRLIDWLISRIISLINTFVTFMLIHSSFFILHSVIQCDSNSIGSIIRSESFESITWSNQSSFVAFELTLVDRYWSFINHHFSHCDSEDELSKCQSNNQSIFQSVYQSVYQSVDQKSISQMLHW